MSKSPPFRLLILAGIVLLGGCAPADVGTEANVIGTEANVISAVFGTAENLELMRAAENISVCRLTPQGERDAQNADQEDVENLREYVEGQFVAVSPQQAARFRRILESPSTYLFEIAKSCNPVFGVRIRFTSKDGEIDVNLCFECMILVIRRDGEAVGGEDFDSAEDELIALCQELFPNDPEIRSLKSH